MCRAALRRWSRRDGERMTLLGACGVGSKGGLQARADRMVCVYMYGTHRDTRDERQLRRSVGHNILLKESLSQL